MTLGTLTGLTQLPPRLARTSLGGRGSGYVFGVRRIRTGFLAGVAGLTPAACGSSTSAAPPPIPSTTSGSSTTTGAPPTPATMVPTTAAPTTTASTTTVAPAVATPPTTAAPRSVCEPSQLNINLAPSGGAGGNEFYAFNVVNISQQACPIGGYFGVSIYDPAGQLVSAADGREDGPSGPSPALDLAPNRTAANLPTGPHRETAQRRVRGSGRRHSGYDHHVIDVDSETSPEPLPRYGIERWTAPEPSRRPGPWTASRTAHGVLYLNSASWTYSDPGGQAIEIGSLRLPLLVSVRAEAERIQPTCCTPTSGTSLEPAPRS
jgi:hypothetical protein